MCLKEKLLKVEETVDPELIIWDNYGIRLPERILRRSLFVFFLVALLLGCFDSVV